MDKDRFLVEAVTHFSFLLQMGFDLVQANVRWESWMSFASKRKQRMITFYCVDGRFPVVIVTRMWWWQSSTSFLSRRSRRLEQIFPDDPEYKALPHEITNENMTAVISQHASFIKTRLADVLNGENW